MLRGNDKLRQVRRAAITRIPIPAYFLALPAAFNLIPTMSSGRTH